MYIEGRKKKTFSQKLVAEVTLFIIASKDQAVRAFKYHAEFGNPSMRTVYRYAKDIELCGYAPRIRCEDGEYTVGLDAELYRESAPQSADLHIRRLSRILQIYDAYVNVFIDALYPDGGSYDIGIAEGPIHVELPATKVLRRLQEHYPEEPITLRTVQRDLAVIAEALEHYRNIRVRS